MLKSPNSIQKSKYWLLIGFVLFVHGVLAYRFFQVQIVYFDLYSQRAESNRIRATSIPAPRGLIVDQNCLIDSLKKGKIKAYLTDVLEEEPMIKNHPLLQFDNVMITPHIGSRTFESVQRQGMMAIDNLFKALNIS